MSCKQAKVRCFLGESRFLVQFLLSCFDTFSEKLNTPAPADTQHDNKNLFSEKLNTPAPADTQYDNKNLFSEKLNTPAPADTQHDNKNFFHQKAEHAA
jgi:hypothetical protein